MINLTSLVSMMTGRTGAESAKAGETGLATGGEFAALVQLAALNGSGEASANAGLGLVVSNDGAAAAGIAGVPGEGLSADILALLGEDKLALTAPDRSATDADDGKTVEAQAPVPQDLARVRASLEAALAGLRGEADTDTVTDTASTDESATDATTTDQPMQAQVIPFPLGLGVTAMSAHVTTASGSKGGRASASPQEVAAKTAEALAPSLPSGTEDEAAAEGIDLAEAFGTQGATPGKPVSAAAPDAAQRFVVDLPVGMATETAAIAGRGAAGSATPSAAAALGAEVIDMGVSGQWIDRLAREISGLAEGGGHSRFSLNPPHLGRLEVDVFQGADAMDIRLTTETDEAAQRLNEGRGTLQADARIASLQLGQITVEKAGASSDAARDQGQAQGQAQREMAGQMQQQDGRQAQGRGQDGDRAGWSTRGAGEQSRQPDESTVARRDRADGHVRFA
ncbi:MAG: flagellar hook-length control protein FliK [Alphaproteobacteria bacterium]|nr:flagellar hook-length control protein FliK [Alphaproteobacteria bacterium]MBU0795177.1 flagellar hook-length control protein FliK [Alphaproteobacteria bacterium]MBU0874924.1 flagellar hook-length control protein FliK [Alphaproteobacteria bacterium]MBU1769539.1 flagellar hook-length control protein FliK [Alphaproteobacteria bacterium]